MTDAELHHVQWLSDLKIYVNLKNACFDFVRLMTVQQDYNLYLIISWSNF